MSGSTMSTTYLYAQPKLWDDNEGGHKWSWKVLPRKLFWYIIKSVSYEFGSVCRIQIHTHTTQTDQVTWPWSPLTPFHLLWLTCVSVSSSTYMYSQPLKMTVTCVMKAPSKKWAVISYRYACEPGIGRLLVHSRSLILMSQLSLLSQLLVLLALHDQSFDSERCEQHEWIRYS